MMMMALVLALLLGLVLVMMMLAVLERVIHVLVLVVEHAVSVTAGPVVTVLTITGSRLSRLSRRYIFRIGPQRTSRRTTSMSPTLALATQTQRYGLRLML
jgi:hypothetical protein